MQAVRSRLSWKQFKQKLFFNIKLYTAYGFLRLLFMTMRCRVLDPENIEKAKSLSKNGKYIAPIWHQNIISNFFYFDSINPTPIFSMVSFSRDGIFLNRLIGMFNRESLHGGSARAGGIGVIKVVRYLISSDERYTIYTSGVDGPLGPIHEIKWGIVQISRMAKVPIVPMVMLPNRYWQASSWDRFRLPKPFSTLYVAPCSPVVVEKATTKAEFPAIAQAIKETMLNKEKEIRERFNIKS